MKKESDRDISVNHFQIKALVAQLLPVSQDSGNWDLQRAVAVATSPWLSGCSPHGRAS